MQKISLQDKNVFNQVVEVLKNGGAVMYPTETCYGLAVDIFNKKALEKLYRIKAMPEDKPVSILVDSLTMAQKYGIFSVQALDLANKFWPGPLSIVVPRKKALPQFLNLKEDFVSIRFSSLQFCLQMVRKLGRPVTTTSANKTGEPQFYEAQDLEGVDLIVDGGKLKGDKPSTVVKVEGERMEVLRQGEVLLDF